MKKFIKKNIKIILGFILGLIWSGGIVYAAANGYLFNSDEVSYDNTASGLESTNVQDALDELYANSDAYLAGLNAAHPVGSYLETSDSSYDPNVSIGGTWVKETEGMVHVSGGTTYTVSKANNSSGAGAQDGGNKDAIVPYHNHSVDALNTGGMSANSTHSHAQLTWASNQAAGAGYYPTRGNGGANWESGNTKAASTAHTHQVPAHNTNYAGTEGNATNANMQPYINVYRWHRTA